MKIFGIGLSRTGTLSLAGALRELGYKTIHYPQPPLMPDIVNVINNYDAACDVPVVIAYKELDKLFPGSKFILTTRNFKTWIRSCENFHFFRIKMVGQKRIVRMLVYGYNGFHKILFKRTYTTHHAGVRKYFENRDDLLIMDITKGDGWEKLCKFLDKPIPNKPFPHRHKAKVQK